MPGQELLPEVFFADDGLPRATLSDWARAGTVRRLGSGVYTTATRVAPEDVVRRNWRRIVAHKLPGAVITDRSGPDPRPLGGVLYVVHPTRHRPLVLPGLTVWPRRGPGRLEGDLPVEPGLWVASPARWLLDNSRPTRSSSADAARRTMDDGELADAVDRLAASVGERLTRIRQNARDLAPLVGPGVRHEVVDRLIGIASGTRPDETVQSRALEARQRGEPFDRARVELFERIAHDLAGRDHHDRVSADATAPPMAAFFEAYFSNFIEGTEFEIDEALGIITAGLVPANRPADAHDIRGTHELVCADGSGEDRSARAFLERLQREHAILMRGRPDKGPGQLKERPNRVGGHLFVEPSYVVGTLSEGWHCIARLDDPFDRALLTMFVVAEVHPFEDGNGRIARLASNRVLSRAGITRLIVPTVYRNDYLRGLRGLSTVVATDSYIRIMEFAHRWTTAVDWSTIDSATADLNSSRALLSPDDADHGLSLRLPVRIAETE